MRIAVAIAAVLDPKWPIELDGEGRPLFRPDRLILSPFDESALEIALRLRDLDPEGVSISAIVTAEKIARTLAAFRIDDIAILDIPFDATCDACSTAAALAGALDGQADLVLIGREFGDCDDGAVPPLLARLLDRPFFGRVQDVKAGTGLLREGLDEEEVVALSAPILCSVTNDRRNRLRKPLMKNVVTARTAQFRTMRLLAAETPDFEGLRLVADARKPVQCEMAQGEPQAIAALLAARIREAKAA